MTDNAKPGRFGAADEIGAVNLLTAEHVVRAAALVKRGKVYSLSVPVTPKSLGYAQRKYEVHIHAPLGLPVMASNRVCGLDEFVMIWPGLGTHVDGLGHVGIDGRYYNGLGLPDFAAAEGLKKLGTEKIPPVAARGVMLDITAVRGVEMLEGGEAITVADIEQALAREKLSLATGDVVLLRTGWIRVRDEDPQRYLASSPGLGKEAARFLARHGVVVVGCDQGSTDVHPAEDPTEFAPVHQINLTENGIYQLQHITLEALARDGVHEFMFVLGIPRLAGTSQMMVDPLAIC
jgi:kynurenine formamidase